jgi:multidrug resistance efflux pump
MSTHPLARPGIRRGWPGVLVLLGLLLLTVSASVARALLGDAGPGGGARAADGGPPRSLACVGYVDVAGGVLSLSPTVPGRVTEVPAQENESVRAGTVLLRLEDDAERADVAQAEAELRAAEARLTEARKGPKLHRSLLAQQEAAVDAVRHDLEAARLIITRKRKLIEGGYSSQEEVDALQAQVGKLEAGERGAREKLRALKLPDPQQDVTRAEAEVRGRRAVLDKAQYALRQCAVTAPADGEVLRVLAQRGDVFGPQSRQPALLFLPAEPRVVRAEVEQEFAGHVVVGQRAEVTDDASADGPTWAGRVTRISGWFAPRRVSLPDVSQPSDVRTLECLVQLDSGQPAPRIGRRVRVKLYQE